MGSWFASFVDGATSLWMEAVVSSGEAASADNSLCLEATKLYFKSASQVTGLFSSTRLRAQSVPPHGAHIISCSSWFTWAAGEGGRLEDWVGPFINSGCKHPALQYRAWGFHSSLGPCRSAGV